MNHRNNTSIFGNPQNDRWLKYAFILPALLILLYSCKNDRVEKSAHKEEWISLFNGENLDGWDIKITGFPVNENYLDTFVAEDSMIRIKYDAYENFGTAFGHMYYKQPFSYYKLRFDYRFLGDQLEGGASWNVRNSGIMLHSQSAASNETDQHFPVSVELQLLGGLGEGERTTANVCTPGTAVFTNDTINYNHCISSNSATYHGDRWVHAEAVVLGGESMHFIVENDTVLQFRNPQIGGGFISDADGRSDWEDFGIVRDKDLWLSKAGNILTEGYIALQAESHPIDFKNLELLNLCGCMDPEAKNYKSYYVKNDAQSCTY